MCTLYFNAGQFSFLKMEEKSGSEILAPLCRTTSCVVEAAMFIITVTKPMLFVIREFEKIF
jgi:hypothetical protein